MQQAHSNYTIFKKDGIYDVYVEDIDTVTNDDDEPVTRKVILEFAKQLMHVEATQKGISSNSTVYLNNYKGGPLIPVSVQTYKSKPPLTPKEVEMDIEKNLKYSYGQLKVVHGKAVSFATDKKGVDEINDEDGHPTLKFIVNKNRSKHNLGSLKLETLNSNEYEEGYKNAARKLIETLRLKQSPLTETKPKCKDGEATKLGQQTLLTAPKFISKEKRKPLWKRILFANV